MYDSLLGKGVGLRGQILERMDKFPVNLVHDVRWQGESNFKESGELGLLRSRTKQIVRSTGSNFLTTLI